MASLTLVRQGNPLADPAEQRRHLLPRADQRPFEAALANSGLFPLRASGVDVLQINVGKLCNQTCHHCHVDAGPERREVMTRATMQHCLDALARWRIGTLDITGGAPEMNPDFRWLVEQARVLAPLAPVLRGEGTGVRGSAALKEGHVSSRAAPSPPSPLPRSTGGEGGNQSPLAPVLSGEGTEVRGAAGVGQVSNLPLHHEWQVGNLPHGRQARSTLRIIDRCNLTILVAPGFDDLPAFLAAHAVEVVASLPCYLPSNTDRQRGAGVFDRSIRALKVLNSLGYGREGTGLSLTLVYNPVGPSLPPAQAGLEAAYRRELESHYGVVFNSLITITNMPISRFLDDLLAQGRYDEYMNKLIAAYNPAAAAGVMCRNMLSVDWEGRLFDCDFNQMLDLGIAPDLPQRIEALDDSLLARRIVTGQHCYGCTAGSGSGCQGAIVGS